MALDLLTKVTIRRLLGIPAAGIPSQNTTSGLRTVTRAGQLELYMNALQSEEESTLLGRPYGAFIIYGPPVLNTVYTVTINGTPYTYQVVNTDLIALDPLISVANGIKNALAASGLLVAAGAISAINTGFNTFLSSAVQVSLQSLTTTFTLTATNAAVLATGSAFPSPSYVVDDGNGVAANATVAYGLLPVALALETQLNNAAQNLSFSKVGSDTTGAAVFRPDELHVRNELFKKAKYELGVFLSFYPATTAMQSPNIRV